MCTSFISNSMSRFGTKQVLVKDFIWHTSCSVYSCNDFGTHSMKFCSKAHLISMRSYASCLISETSTNAGENKLIRLIFSKKKDIILLTYSEFRPICRESLDRFYIFLPPHLNRVFLKKKKFFFTSHIDLVRAKEGMNGFRQFSNDILFAENFVWIPSSMINL